MEFSRRHSDFGGCVWSRETPRIQHQLLRTLLQDSMTPPFFSDFGIGCSFPLLSCSLCVCVQISPVRFGVVSVSTVSVANNLFLAGILQAMSNSALLNLLTL